MIAVQVQAMAAQSVPPLPKFSGEDINTEEGSVDRWIERIEERAKATGWNEEQKLFQLKAHLEKTAEHAVRMLPEEKKSKYDSVVTALRNRFCSLDIEELRGLEFHQLMQDKQGVEELGVELQKLGRKAFPTSGPKEFDRMMKGTFYQSLLPKWQRKLGAPKATESFDELYARARTMERHDQQFNSGRGDSRQLRGKINKPPIRNETVKKVEEQSSKYQPERGLTRFPRKKGCFTCGDFGHIQRNCPKWRPEATGRSGKVSALAATERRESVDELSIQQLEQLLAKKRLKAEQTQLCKGVSKIETIASDAANAVGPIVYLDVIIEGHPVKAVVDSGAQSTILSPDLLHQIARHMQSQGRSVPKLAQPSVKLYGRSGDDCSELTITAQAQLELTLDGHTVKTPVFIQPGSEIQCLLGINVLPHLGVQFLRENGLPLLLDPPLESEPSKESVEGNSSQRPQTDILLNQKAPLSTMSMEELASSSPIDHPYQNATADSTLAMVGRPMRSNVSIIRSTHLPNRRTTVLEAEVTVPFANGDALLFEPTRDKALAMGLEIPDALLTQLPNGRVLIPIENHASVAARLEPRVCVGTVVRVDDNMLHDRVALEEPAVVTAETLTETSVRQDIHGAIPGDHGEGEVGAQCARICDQSSLLVDRLQKLFDTLSLEKGSLTDDQFSCLKKLIADYSDVFALDSTELGHTDLVQHHVDTGDSQPVKQPARRVPFVYRERISSMVKEMQHLGVIKPSSSAWASAVVLVPKKDGTYRFCVEYRRLNSLTRKDVHPLPRIDDILDTLGGTKYFSTLDLAAGYWHIDLDTESAAKSAFVTPGAYTSSFACLLACVMHQPLFRD